MSMARELSKALGKAAEAACEELLRCVKFVLGTKLKGLKLNPKMGPDGSWALEVHCHSDWSGDPNGRKSVQCYIIFLNGVPIA